MLFINYYRRFTTWTVWTAGLLVKDALTLVFEYENNGIFYVEVVINYSARGYGCMIKQHHYYLDGRMLEKHKQYMDKVNNFRDDYVIPRLEGLKGRKFDSVKHFIRDYNEFISFFN